MNFYVNHYNLTTGDRIIVPKSGFNIVQHHALVLHNYYGVDYIIECDYIHGVRIVTVDEFFRINPKVTRIERFTGTYSEQHHIMQRAMTQVGKPYSLWNYNCEHFVNEILFGKKESKQVSNFSLGAGVVALLLLVFSESKS